MEKNICIVGVRNFDGESYVEYDAYIHLAKEMSTEFEKHRNEIDCLSKEYEEFRIKSFQDKDNLEKLQKDFERLDKKNEALQDENNELKAEIQRLEEKCGETSAHTDKVCISDDSLDYEDLYHKSQYQHQQDCILINNLNVTIDKLVDRYANLRKNVEM